MDWKSEASQELPAGDHLLRVRLERYRLARSPGPGEILLSIPLHSRASQQFVWPTPLWLLWPAAAFGLVWLVRRLRWDDCRVEMIESGSAAPLSTRWEFWRPVARLLVYRPADAPLDIAPSSNLPAGAEVLASVVRRGRRRLSVKLLGDLPGHRRGEAIEVKGDAVFSLGEQTLAVTYGSTVPT